MTTSTIIDKRFELINKYFNRRELRDSFVLKNIDNSVNTEYFNGEIERRVLSEDKSADAKTILSKKTLSLRKFVGTLNSNLVYIKSGAYGHTFKGLVYNEDGDEISNYALKVVAFSKKEGYGSINNLSRPENSEIRMLKLLSYFVVKRITPHIILPLHIFNTSIQKFIELYDNDEEVAKNDNYTKFVKNYKNSNLQEQVSILVSEWANRGDLGMFLRKHYKKLELIHWKCILFQLIFTLAIIQSKYPKFRHNDLKANNILISKVENDNKKRYVFNDKKFELPPIGYNIYIWDFDFACIPGIVDNDKVRQEWTNSINIKPVQNRYYDIHYFFSTLVYKGFLPDLLDAEEVPKELKDFIHYVIPKEYRPGSKKVPKRCRLLVNEEYTTPAKLLNHDFFKELVKQ